MVGDDIKNKIIIGIVVGSVLATGGALYGTLIALPKLEQRLDDEIKHVDTKLSAERDRSTVIDNYTTQWLKATSDRSLSNASRIKGLETSTGIHHNNHKE